MGENCDGRPRAGGKWLLNSSTIAHCPSSLAWRARGRRTDGRTNSLSSCHCASPFADFESQTVLGYRRFFAETKWSVFCLQDKAGLVFPQKYVYTQGGAGFTAATVSDLASLQRILSIRRAFFQKLSKKWRRRMPHEMEAGYSGGEKNKKRRRPPRK